MIKHEPTISREIPVKVLKKRRLLALFNSGIKTIKCLINFNFKISAVKTS